jgi:hypothetical protein
MLAAGGLEDDSLAAPQETHGWLTHVVPFDPREPGESEAAVGGSQPRRSGARTPATRDWCSSPSEAYPSRQSRTRPATGMATIDASEQ